MQQNPTTKPIRSNGGLDPRGAIPTCTPRLPLLMLDSSGVLIEESAYLRWLLCQLQLECAGHKLFIPFELIQVPMRHATL